ncbi:MAG TPA: fructose-1,6-bisphosphatase [Euryarchaeota archaeon]|nr:fructose-1,6-bisphosphatase [Euryarchaeota archaeon]
MRQLLERIAEAVQKRIAELPTGFDGSEQVSVGASGSPTSRIDKLAEDVVIDFVRTSELDMNILSEEAGMQDIGSERTLVVDPVDGTANFHSEIPFYAVSLALGSSRLGDVTHGLVRNLVSGETYYAEKGKGAWLDDVSISTREFEPGSSLFLAYVGNRTDASTWKVAEKVRRIRSLGCASLEMCHIGRGMADGFYFNCLDLKKRMRIVDIAASALVLREAGGELFNMDGKVLDMAFSLDDRSNFLALGDPGAKEMIL